jgi:hypothetical protein
MGSTVRRFVVNAPFVTTARMTSRRTVTQRTLIRASLAILMRAEGL